MRDSRWLLDTSARLALRDDEPGADRVLRLLQDAQSNVSHCLVCFMSRMEVLHRVWMDEGERKARLADAQLQALPIPWAPASDGLLEQAAALKASHPHRSGRFAGVTVSPEGSWHPMGGSDLATGESYAILIPAETRDRATDYLRALRDGDEQPGALLRSLMGDRDPATLTAEDLLARLFDTKRPQIFAEMEVAGDGSDWNLIELGLLGDLSIHVPVTVFDDGKHTQPTPHEPPFTASLCFVASALLRNGMGHPPADWAETVSAGGELCPEGYFQLYRRRLLPVLQHINALASTPRSAFVTIPGLGCGLFAGPFRGRLGPRLQAVLERLLNEHGPSLPNIKALYFDPYSECENVCQEIHGISFLVRPLRAPGNQARSQLCRPQAYAEPGEDVSGCSLTSLVAWDHVSWPGNDFYGGARATDDGVKAAATSAMAVLTGLEGTYDAAHGKYQPPDPYRTWGDVVAEARSTRGLRLWNPRCVWRP